MPQDRPQASSADALARMKRQARSNTRPELDVRRVLHARGLRYRLQVPVPGLPRRTIDICFPRSKVAVFLDGCFWHGCPQHATEPKNNADWWRAKLQRNHRRDGETSAHLSELGWIVLRFWSHEPAEEVANVIGDVVAGLSS